jgi:hypothetical protein
MSQEKPQHASQGIGYARLRANNGVHPHGCEWCVSEEHCSRCFGRVEQGQGLAAGDATGTSAAQEALR